MRGETMKNFIQIDELEKQPDAVWLYAGADASEEESFRQNHLPGSHFLSLEEDLTGDKTTGRGRHPLPEMNAFADRMMALGISQDTPVRIYGNGLTMAAYRLWWMLKAVGVREVKFLFDPNARWKEQGTNEKTGEVSVPGQGLAFDPRSIVEMNQVRRFIEREDVTLIDSRDADRYHGIKDEMDHKPGHIPTALSYPYESLHREKMPEPEEIREHFRDLPRDKPVVVYCGSGVSAPWNMMLLDEIGIDTTLYPGSFSGWIEDASNPIEK